MSVHIGAVAGDIANAVLLPGDPLRAKFIADTFFKDAFCYNEVRGMLGFTGFYKGKRISVQGTGMGLPSLSIYVNELLNDYKVKTLIRVGTCGALQDSLQLRDVVLASAASSDSNMNNLRFRGLNYAPTASFRLLAIANEIALRKGITPAVGNVFSTDSFYSDQPGQTELLRKYGVLAAEMETSELYTLAAAFKADALSVLTVSDHIITGARTTAEERQSTFLLMAEIALETAVALL